MKTIERDNVSLVGTNFTQKSPFVTKMRPSHCLSNGQESVQRRPRLKREVNIMKSISQMEEKINPQEKKQHAVCFRCGRKLRTPLSKELGLGPTCYEKWKRGKKTPRLIEVKNV